MATVATMSAIDALNQFGESYSISNDFISTSDGQLHLVILHLRALVCLVYFDI